MIQTVRRMLPFVGAFALFGGFFVIPASALAIVGNTDTFLGKIYSGDRKDGMKAYVDMPQAFTIDNKGQIFIADTSNNVIRRLDTKNIITTFSGTGEYGLRDGPRNLAQWSAPEGITFEDGVFYVSDTGSHKIRKIQSGTVSTLPIAGLLIPRAITDDGSILYIFDAGHSRIVRVAMSGGTPEDLATGLGNVQKMCVRNNRLFFTDWTNGKIMRLDLRTKVLTELARGLTEPKGITCDGKMLYFTAGQNGVWNEIWSLDLSEKKPKKRLVIIRRETTSLNDVTDILIAKINREQGEEVTDPEGDKIEKAEEAKDQKTKNSKKSLKKTKKTSVISMAAAKRKKKVTKPKPVKLIYQLHGGGSAVFTTTLDGLDLRQHVGKNRYADEDGNRSKAEMGHPVSLVMTPDDSKMIIGYMQGNKLGEYSFKTNTFKGTAGFPRDSYAENVGLDIRMSGVTQTAVSPDGSTLYFTDRNNSRIRKFNLKSFKSSYLTGAGLTNSDPSLVNGYQEGKPCKDEMETDQAGCAYFNRPAGLALSNDGMTLYIADTGNHRIRTVDVRTGRTALLAGSGVAGFVNGVGSAASFNYPYTLSLSNDNRYLYIVDKDNHAIRQLDLLTKAVTTVVGRGTIGWRDGTLEQGVMAIPEHIYTLSDGDLVVGEAGSARIRRIDLTAKTITTLSGSGQRGAIDGLGTMAEWMNPKGMAEHGGKLYVADFKNDLIRVIDLQ